MTIDPNQPAFLRVPVKCLETVIAALRANGFESEARNVEDFTEHYTDPVLNEDRRDWLKRAIKQAHKDGEIEFDSDATISDSGNVEGQYVLGWVWVEKNT